MFTGIRKTIIAGVLAGFAAMLLAAPASARLPQPDGDGATAGRTPVIGLNSLYAKGCVNGTILDNTTGGDNNNYDYFGNPCGF